MEKACQYCRWHENCICVVCEDETMVVCSLQHKHVSKSDCCDKFKILVNK